MTARLLAIASSSWAVLDSWGAERGLPEPDEWSIARLCNVTERLYLEAATGDADRQQRERDLRKPLPGEELDELAQLEGTAFDPSSQLAAFQAAVAAQAGGS